MPKTIFINGRFLTHPVTGVQRYAREVIGAIDDLLGSSPAFSELEIVCLTPRQRFIDPGWSNIEIHRTGVNRGNLWEQLHLPLAARGGLLFSPANSGPAFYQNHVVTMQDAATFAVPASYGRLFRAKYWLLYRRVSRRARALLTVSKFSRSELTKYLHIPPERFMVIPSGCGHLARVTPDPSYLSRHGLYENSYWLVVASPQAHKNIALVVDAVGRLGGDPIVAVAGVGAGARIANASKSAARFRWLGDANDRELKALYQGARALIVPSLYEGFGLPVLEAMECGCPVSCAQAGALPEVAADAAVYFDPTDVESLTAVLQRFMAEPALCEQLRATGYARAAAHPWSLCARQVLEVLAKAAADNGRPRLTGRQRAVKRALDLLLVLAALPLIVVLILLIALAIRLDTPGPALYSQERLGYGGKKIQIWKFRSMAVNAESILEAHLASSPQLRAEWEASHKLKKDPRTTRVGRLLRHTSLDELPQLWNVLRGEMSLVGPRPIVQEELSLYGEEFEIYKQAVPGLTGLWQVSGRNDLEYDERVRLDVRYVRAWSLIEDLRILLRTVLVAITGHGAY